MTVHPWDDPNLKTLYHVQLETKDLLVSYEIATPDFDAVDLAKADLAGRLPPETPIWCGSTSSIGYVPLDSPAVVDVRVVAGQAPFPVAKEQQARGRLRI
ncbi:MAG: hypothetical protein EBS48_11490 [Actinobacteria bacterium]|nr:hypothetical protein [Actinomycetota bacterium]